MWQWLAEESVFDAGTEVPWKHWEVQKSRWGRLILQEKGFTVEDDLK
jgi:hypothetical protein